MNEQLTCQRMIRKDDGYDAQNRPRFHHEKCGKPASEVQIRGSLTTAKAILCPRHASAAEKQAFLSINGFPKGKVEAKAAEKGYKQTQIEPAVK